ncbi:hypothetical protein C1645_745874 [Glomus cerebriforme]|uniref:Uncharacterized protein n=1 Tax=Glomus cerebriforme TaxID=658196 RepID=A0A397S424_9GLOM|nr:hypothetical protein C1645_745874 [Glomus cerebriforme]
MGTILSNNRTQKMKRDKNCQITSDFCMYTTMGGVRRSKPPENTPEWAYDAEKIRIEATDIEILEYRINNNNDKMTQYDNASLTDPNLDYLLNSAEMNLIWPEDLDEIGESSQSIIYIILTKKSRKEKESKGEKKANPEEETINTIFNIEVVYSDS